MNLLLIGLGVLVGGGLLAMFAERAPRTAGVLGAAGAVAGCALALVPAISTLARGVAGAPLAIPWNVPYGAFVLQLDPLSAWFLTPILGLSAVAAVFGFEYMQHYAGRKPLGAAWFFYNVLVASMVLVVVARNGVLFLVAWEIMALASYFLVVFEDEKPSVREAGRIYLIASHLGTAFLLAFFVLLGKEARSLDFDVVSTWIGNTGGFTPATASLLFVFALVGFGTKAGLMPLHVWLPEAHPVAPSHVSAVMSGVMIKTGIYGLLRALAFLGTPPAWWAWLLIGVGVVSGVWGLLFALAQHDMKRLLAYSSVENVGIIALGMGVGLLGVSLDIPGAAVLGFAGALLHVVNHSLFKGLLFLGAGAVLHSTGTVRLDRLGGLLKKMPWLAVAFAVGCVAISGMPPLNGFLGEFMIYLGAFEEETLSGPAGGIPALAIIGGLALIGGLAVACFTKLFSVVFLGVSRESRESRVQSPEPADHSHGLPPVGFQISTHHSPLPTPHSHVGLLMQGPMLLLAAGCLLVAMFSVPLLRAMSPMLVQLTGQSPAVISRHVDAAAGPLSSVVWVSIGVLAAVGGLTLVRQRLLSGRDVGATETWGCGYAQPTPRMQYTSTSFSEPIITFFASLLTTRVHLERPQGLFPGDASLQTRTLDSSIEKLYRPAFSLVGWLLSKLTWIHHGHLHLYVLYIAVAMVSLLVWYLGISR